MAGRSSKKSQNNFDKLKREMKEKKKKADIYQKPVISEHNLQQNTELSQAIAEDYDKANSTNSYQEQTCQNKCTEPVLQKIDISKRDSCEDNRNRKILTHSLQQDEKEIIAVKKNVELLIFTVDEEEYAFYISKVKEIIRIPQIIKLPNSPEFIIGLCDLRGELLPVIDTSKLFNIPSHEICELGRIIVTEINGQKVGIISDKVTEVIRLNEEAVKEPPASIRGIDGQFVDGIVILDSGKRAIVILDADIIGTVGKLTSSVEQKSSDIKDLKISEKQKLDEEQILIFNIGDGEYGFHINHVAEIIRIPELIKVPNAPCYIEGLFSIRKQLLAVINLGKLLGMESGLSDESSRVVVLNYGSFSFGVIVDKVAHIATVSKKFFYESSQIDYCSGSEYIKGVISLENGKRLIMMLQPHKLIHLVQGNAVVACDGIDDKKDNSLYAEEADCDLEHIVIFKLGKEEYAIEIKNVQEISRIGEIRKFPGAPAFIDGIIDLRGDIIPILNLRGLLDVKESNAYSNSNILVVEFEKKKIGIRIDQASEIIRIPKNCIEDAPELFDANHQNDYVHKIAKLNNNKRNIMLLKLSALLSFM